MTPTPTQTINRSWAEDRFTASLHFQAVETRFRDELVRIGRAQMGPGHPDDVLVRAARVGSCHCGRCSSRYARCTFSAPRHIGDVFSNLYSTGTKAAAYVAQAASKADYWPNFSAAISLGCGAGGCLTGLRIADRLPVRRFGVEIEPHARRLLPHVVPNVLVKDDIRALTLPTGNLLVVASLVWNLRVPSALWAEEIARGRDEFWVLSVTRPRDFKNFHPAQVWRELGFEPHAPYDLRDPAFRAQEWHPEGDLNGYGVEIDQWRRK